jgi:maltoporin
VQPLLKGDVAEFFLKKLEIVFSFNGYQLSKLSFYFNGGKQQCWNIYYLL